MNKYQEALDELSFPLDDSSCGGCKCGTSDCRDCKKAIAVLTLEELVEKATPKKKKIYAPLGLELCPTCGKDTYREFFKCCPNCGQRLEYEE